MMVGGVIAKCAHTIEDVWVSVQEVFKTAGIECEFLFGEQNRELNGKPPRIVFERAPGSFQFAAGRMGKGELALISDACVARVWGREATRDYSFDQARAAIGLVVELIGALITVAPRVPNGVNGLEIDFSTDTHVIKYGEQFVVSIRVAFPVQWATQGESLLNAGTNANLNKRS